MFSRSDFLRICDFPEVYHGERGSKAPDSAVARAVTGQGINTTYRRNCCLRNTTSCVSGARRAGAAEKDPELTENGSAGEK